MGIEKYYGAAEKVDDFVTEKRKMQSMKVLQSGYFDYNSAFHGKFLQPSSRSGHCSLSPMVGHHP